MKEKQIRELVRKKYGEFATQSGSCCGPKRSCCGSGATRPSTASIGQAIGYSQEELASAPEASNLGLGCGNPLALASLKGGETVLDLGSGAGFDSFLAARRVGEKGKVIGVDMTAEMVEKARENAKQGSYSNVEFRLGEIENLPIADAMVDLIISNCVINLSVDKARVFQEAFRVLKPGGRLMISDIVLLGELPKKILESAAAYAGCVAGALVREEYLALIRQAGFDQVQVARENPFGSELVLEDPLAQSLIEEWNITADEARRIGQNIVSINVSARKPAPKD